MSTNKVTFAHLRRIDMWGHASPFGGVTLALQEDGNDVKVGIAVCHDHDRYIKAEGRNRAAGRLHSKSAENEKFRGRLTGVTVQDVYKSVDNDYLPSTTMDVLDNTIMAMIHKAGAQS